MKKLTLILIAALLSMTTIAQTDTSFKYLKSIKGDIIAFTVDNIDNIYLLSSTNQIKKLNANGDSVAVYNNVKRYGQATLMDVSSPLRIIIYYRDFATIVVLDRFLNEVNTIDLRKQNIFQAKAAGLSFDNKIWVYDEVENKLKKVDETGKLIQETPDFRQLFDSAPSPEKIFDQDKFVYLYDSTQGVFVFDYYGSLKNKLLIQGWNNFRAAGKYLFGSKGNKLLRYDIGNFRIDEWEMPPQLQSAKAFSFSLTRLYTLKQDEIEIYNFR